MKRIDRTLLGLVFVGLVVWSPPAQAQFSQSTRSAWEGLHGWSWGWSKGYPDYAPPFGAITELTASMAKGTAGLSSDNRWSTRPIDMQLRVTVGRQQKVIAAGRTDWRHRFSVRLDRNLVAGEVVNLFVRHPKIGFWRVSRVSFDRKDDFGRTPKSLGPPLAGSMTVKPSTHYVDLCREHKLELAFDFNHVRMRKNPGVVCVSEPTGPCFHPIVNLPEVNSWWEPDGGNAWSRDGSFMWIAAVIAFDRTQVGDYHFVCQTESGDTLGCVLTVKPRPRRQPAPAFDPPIIYKR